MTKGNFSVWKSMLVGASKLYLINMTSWVLIWFCLSTNDSNTRRTCRRAGKDYMKMLFYYMAKWRKILIMDESDWKTLQKKIIKEQAKERQQDDNEQHDTVSNIKLVDEGIQIKQIRRLTENLNAINTRMIMTNLTPHIEM